MITFASVQKSEAARAPKPGKEVKRRYATLYYSSASDSGDPTSRGAASTEATAIRSAVFRVFLNQHGYVVIFDRLTGVPAYTVRNTGQGIRISYGMQVPGHENLRRVK